MTGPTSEFCASDLKRLATCPNANVLLTDHTCLGNNDTIEDIEKLVMEAIGTQPNSVAICIHWHMIPHAKKFLAQRGNNKLLIATVVNFPLGRDPVHKVLEDTRLAVSYGANEVDLVIDYELIKRNKQYGLRAAEDLVAAVRAVCPRNLVTLKVIIETGELQKAELIIGASIAAMKSGADFIKTSTGKVPVNATLESCKLMLSSIAAFQAVCPERDVGFKPAGGIKTPQQALELLRVAEDTMGAGWLNSRHFRFGASSLLAVMRKSIEGCKEPSANTSSTTTGGSY